MTVRIGRTLAGRLLHKLVGGVNRLCTSCCAPATGCCAPGRRPVHMFLTITLTSGADLCAFGGLVIPITNPTPGSPSTSWGGTVTRGPIYLGSFLNDCTMTVTSGAPCNLDATVVFVSGDCATNTYTYTATNLGSSYTIVVSP